MKQLTISVDYDGTYSADPALWNLFISFAIKKHIVIMVTARCDNDPVIYTGTTQIPIFYTAGADKDPYMKDLDIPVDIWIEDRPQSVGKVDYWEFCDEQQQWINRGKEDEQKS